MHARPEVERAERRRGKRRWQRGRRDPVEEGRQLPLCAGDIRLRAQTGRRSDLGGAALWQRDAQAEERDLVKVERELACPLVELKRAEESDQRDVADVDAVCDGHRLGGGVKRLDRLEREIVDLPNLLLRVHGARREAKPPGAVESVQRRAAQLRVRLGLGPHRLL